MPNAATLDSYCEALGVEALELLPVDDEEERDVKDLVRDLKVRLRVLERAVRT